MIIITIDGLNWLVAKDYFNDLFEVQSMKKNINNVREFSATVEGGSPTVLGLYCLWSGTPINDFHPDCFARLGLIKKGHEEENYPIPFMDKNGNKLDTIFNYFNKCKVQATHNGPCPYLDSWIQKDKYKTYDSYFQSFTQLGDNVEQLPSEDLIQFKEFARRDWDLLHIHTGIGKLGILQPGPYEQTRLFTVNKYEEFRKDKPVKRQIWINGIIRYKYVIQHVIDEMIKDQIVVVSADHGTGLWAPVTNDQIDEVPLIVNRDVDLSDINYQWDIKKLIIRLKELEDEEQI